MSAAGGISIAYVFLHIKPEMHTLQQTLQEENITFLLEDFHIYAAALFGLLLFYGLEKQAAGKHEHTAVFWFRIHVAVFALYNALIGYLLVHGGQENTAELALYVFALSLHFISSDQALRDYHPDEYDHEGRWLLAGSVLAGYAAGLLGSVPPLIEALLFGTVAGALILTVLREELPSEKESHFLSFLAGALLYAALLVMIF